jgi:hypothetical protein
VPPAARGAYLSIPKPDRCASKKSAAGIKTLPNFFGVKPDANFTNPASYRLKIGTFGCETVAAVDPPPDPSLSQGLSLLLGVSDSKRARIVPPPPWGT